MAMKKYRFGLDRRGLMLFLLLMLPNILWALLAGEGDLLMRPSVTPGLDMAASVCQALTVAGMLCLLRRDVPPGKPLVPLLLMAAYLLMWALYGLGAAHPAVLLGLAVFPCAAIIAHLVGRRNMVALIPAALFAVGHTLSTLINFIL